MTGEIPVDEETWMLLETTARSLEECAVKHGYKPFEKKPSLIAPP